MRGLPVDLVSLMGAYHRATLVSFAVLEAAALMGLLVALLSGSSFYQRSLWRIVSSGLAM